MSDDLTRRALDDDDHGCAHKSNEDCLICAGCGACREDLDTEDFCGDCGSGDPGVRLVRCEACDGDGGYGVPIAVNHRTGHVVETWFECSCCGGEGEVWVVVEPVTEEELCEA
jgi:hypothetical protein